MKPIAITGAVGAPVRRRRRERKLKQRKITPEFEVCAAVAQAGGRTICDPWYTCQRVKKEARFPA